MNSTTRPLGRRPSRSLTLLSRDLHLKQMLPPLSVLTHQTCFAVSSGNIFQSKKRAHFHGQKSMHSMDICSQDDTDPPKGFKNWHGHVAILWEGAGSEDPPPEFLCSHLLWFPPGLRFPWQLSADLRCPRRPAPGGPSGHCGEAAACPRAPGGAPGARVRPRVRGGGASVGQGGFLCGGAQPGC